jgi:tetratricopeptide (TPR) repeat protein
MRVWLLSILLLLVLGFTIATTLEPWHQNWEGGRSKSENLIQVALGDSRQLFAKHFFLKADAYFHQGYYPTIYDNKQGFGGAHLSDRPALNSGTRSDEGEENFLGPPRDWIDRFSRNFFPSRHSHLGEGQCNHPGCAKSPGDGHTHEHGDHGDHDDDQHGAPGEGRAAGHDEHDDHHDQGERGDHGNHDEAGESSGSKADEREILPWIKLSLELDPRRVQTYLVGGYWLRTSLHQVDEAERLLRDGLRQVPNDPELLFELGRILLEERKDANRARNVWERALAGLRTRPGGPEGSEVFLTAQLLGNLATLEEKSGNVSAALRHLEALAPISPNKESIARWMESLRQQATPSPAPPAAGPGRP